MGYLCLQHVRKINVCSCFIDPLGFRSLEHRDSNANGSSILYTRDGNGSKICGSKAQVLVSQHKGIPVCNKYNSTTEFLKLCVVRKWVHYGQESCSGTRWQSQIRSKSSDNEVKPQYSSAAKIRSEVIAPFRALRMFFYLAFIASGSVGGLITLTRLAAALGNPSNVQAVTDILNDLGIDLAAVAVFSFLYRSDSKARDVQLAKLSREETLSALRVELGNKKVLTVAQLRGIARLVILAGPGSYIKQALEFGKPYKTDLLERGVLVVPFSTDGAVPNLEIGEAEKENNPQSQSTANMDLPGCWQAYPIYTSEWSKWLSEQKKLASVSDDKPVYISLRLDGRVRGSGVGLPPWQGFVAQLPPLKGIWGGALDGMDGRV